MFAGCETSQSPLSPKIVPQFDPIPGTTFATDFSNYALNTQPTGWSVVWDPSDAFKVVADASVASGKVLQWSTAGWSRNRYGLQYDGFGDFSAQEVYTEMRIKSFDTSVPVAYMGGPVVRMGGTATDEHGYAISFVANNSLRANTIVLQSWTNGGYIQLFDANTTWSTNTWYSVRLQAIDSTLRARVWVRGTAEPTSWLITARSSRYPIGRPGVHNHDNGTVQWERWQVTVPGGSAPPATLVSISLTPAQTSIARGATQQFTVSGSYSDGSTRAVNVTYIASGGTITTSGLYTAGTTAGTFSVIATESTTGKADTSAITITAPTLTGVTMTPPSATMQTGATQQFTTVGNYSDGSTAAIAVTYAATGGSVTSSGLYTAGATAGNYQIVATEAGGRADTSAITITAAPPPPASSLTRTFSEDPLGVQPAGWTETAFGANSDWTITADASASDGRILRNRTTATGRHLFRFDAIPDTTTRQEVLVKMRLGDSDDRGPGVTLRHRMSGTTESAYVAYFRPAGGTIEINRFVNGVWGLVGSATFANTPGRWYWLRFRADGTAIRLRAWADGSAEPTTWNGQFTDGSLTTGSAGLYVYEANTVDYDCFSFAAFGGTAPAPVNGPPPTLTGITMTPASASLQSGASQQFTVIGNYSDGSTGAATVTYAATGGTITSAGSFTAGSSSGVFQVIATESTNGFADTSSVTVTAPPTLVSLTLTPSSATVNPGATQQFSVSGSYSDGSTGSPAVTYVATGGSISASGLFTAGATAGAYQIIATEPNTGIADTSDVNIPAPPTLTALALTPVSATVGAGGTVQFSVLGTYSDGSSGSVPVTYTAAGGTITAAGLFTAAGVGGTFEVIATHAASGIADTSLVTVRVLTAVVLTPASTTLDIGNVQQFSVVGNYSDGTTGAIAATYTATGGSITTGGLYTTGTIPGNYTVIARNTASGLADTAAVTINTPPINPSQQFFTDFSTGTIGQPMPDLMKMRSSNAWNFLLTVRADAGVPSGKILKLEGPGASNGASRPHAWLVVPVDNQQEIVVKLRSTTTTQAAGGAYLSGSVDPITGNPSEYGARLANGVFMMWNYKNGTFNQLTTTASDWVAGRWMWVRLRMTTTQVMAKYWADGNPEPTTWRFTQNRNWGSGTPSVIPNGYAGIYTNTVQSGVEYALIGAAIGGQTAPASGTAVVGNLPRPVVANAQITDDFSTDVLGQIPNGFAALPNATGVTWNITDLGVGDPGIRSNNSNGSRKLLDYTPMTDSATDQELLVRIRPATTDQPYTVGAALRIEPPSGGADSYYLVALGSQSLDFVRAVNGGFTPLVTSPSVPVTYSAGSWYWMRARVQGNLLLGKVWRTDEPEPAQWFHVETVTQIVAGSAGLFHRQQDTTDYDDLSIWW